MIPQNIVTRDFSKLGVAQAQSQMRHQGAVFQGCCFDALDFHDVEIDDLVFTKCSFLNTSFRSVEITSCTFDKCILTGADFRYARLESVVFDTCNCVGINFAEATLTDSILKGSKMSGASLKGMRSLNLDIECTIFESADLGGLYLKGQHIKGVDFSNADLSNADLRGCLFEACSFINTEFRGAKMASADFRDSRLGKSPLHDMARDMKGAIISGAQAAEILQDYGLIVA
ncbi:pentapeptide repeat-containing protein [Profundibacter sp.]